MTFRRKGGWGWFGLSEFLELGVLAVGFVEVNESQGNQVSIMRDIDCNRQRVPY